MTTDAEDRSTWPRNGQVIRRAELLSLLEQAPEPHKVDLRGTRLLNDGSTDDVITNAIDLSPTALRPLAEAYRQRTGGQEPPWVIGDGHAALWDAQLEAVYLARARLQDANLAGANLRRASLSKASLQRANLSGAHLEGADLSYTQLQGTDLSYADVGRADLSYAQLEGARLWSAQLQQARLWGAKLQGADLSYAQLQEANLSGAELQGANLSRGGLEGSDLSGAQLERADLSDARLQGADLFHCHLQVAKLSHAQLQQVDMYDVASLDGALWYGALLDHTRIKRESLGKRIGDELKAHDSKGAEDYHRAEEAYLMLKNNFNQIGRYEDASWAYVKEQQMEKMAYYREWRSGGTQFGSGWDPLWFLSRPAWGSFWRWLRNWAYELATGYGERPWNPVIGGVLIILGFAGGFCATRAIGNFWDALVYSIATFATFNLADTGPTGRAADLASSVEALLGIAVLALVVFTLGNKMSRG